MHSVAAERQPQASQKEGSFQQIMRSIPTLNEPSVPVMHRSTRITLKERLTMRISPSQSVRRGLVTAFLSILFAFPALAYERYNSGCATCHGNFTGSTSTKVPPTVFPNGDKHRMHRNASNMGTDCRLCHTTGDGDDPFTGSSDGIPGVLTGLGCTGCHNAAGLRAHHVANGGGCYTGGCHSAEPAPAENVVPPYYGSTYTKANNPCNDVLLANTNENWSVGDFVGLDNDGDDLYDQADFDCGPAYHLLSAVREGNDVRLSWETVGGRVDVVQASANVGGGYTDRSLFITNPGVGPKVTNYLDIGGATNSARFYRIRNR